MFVVVALATESFVVVALATESVVLFTRIVYNNGLVQTNTHELKVSVANPCSYVCSSRFSD
jgi:hypothetical protein